MKTKSYIDPYNHVSHIYSYLMGFIDYKWWAKYIYAITKNHLIKSPSVLELGAGSCDLANNLSKIFKNYFATDISKNMISGNNFNINKVCCDMAALPFNNKFDLIISAFDSINYLISKKKLTRLFKEVYEHLAENGIFTFDAALVNNSLKHQKSSVTNGKFDEILFKRESKYYPVTRIHKNIFKVTYPNGKTFTEIHKQKIFEFETYFDVAENCNLYVADCYKAFTYQKAKPTSDRVQFVIKRK